jgi:hypothetical protein
MLQFLGNDVHVVANKVKQLICRLLALVIAGRPICLVQMGRQGLIEDHPPGSSRRDGACVVCIQWNRRPALGTRDRITIPDGGVVAVVSNVSRPAAVVCTHRALRTDGVVGSGQA